MRSRVKPGGTGRRQTCNPATRPCGVCPRPRERIALGNLLGPTTNTGATPILGFRRHHHRRGHVGPVPALPVARTGFAGAGVRGRHRCRRHLVLEPLSRRALRFRKLFLRLFVLEGVAGGMGLVGAFCRPAGNAALSQSRRRQVRSAPRYPVSQPGHGGDLRGGDAELDRHARGRQPIPHALPDHRDRPAVDPHPAAHRGARQFQGRSPSTPRDGRTSRSISPASASP